ncbi:phosphopantetheine-binding protein [Allocoprobacillus halotolerans]|uniref:Phosphopantetheine-binding protein n=1 Tax=Allocoprobacillus halotolerans TaxID=2944914 RepID=A0ABY5I506_9FIRM|nr:phosphopantetheine-binding protein [Allocoprobacillus halotolerans]UTY40444.1 phosphopantetheine-binding protein [Allocoprobacillus halotolerans]
MDELLNILKDLKPGVDFENEKNLIDDRILDSLDVMNLIVELNDEFDIEITPLDILPENFQSVETIYQLITRLQEDN